MYLYFTVIFKSHQQLYGGEDGGGSKKLGVKNVTPISSLTVSDGSSEKICYWGQNNDDNDETPPDSNTSEIILEESKYKFITQSQVFASQVTVVMQ